MTKKNFFGASLIFMGVLTFFSCAKEPENHRLTVVYPVNKVFYADHMEDSICFYTFDSWKIIQAPDWVTFTDATEGNDKYYHNLLRYYGVKYRIDPNTTGKTRVGRFAIRSYEYTAGTYAPQVGWLDISYPEGQIEKYNDIYNIPDSLSFTVKDSSYTETDSICFKVESSWTLNYAEPSVQQWVTFDQDFGRSGSHKVNLTLEPNTSTEPRETDLVLTCAGVKNIITVRQSGVKEEEK